MKEQPASPAKSGMSAGTFLSELTRRKVVQRAVLYAIVAWVVVQAADIVIPALNIPEWGVSLVVVLLLLGFPVAMVLAWMFDTPAEVIQGHRRAAPRPARDRRGDEEDAGPRSIAVLPFVNMSDDKENEYFSDGMTEEILNALAKVPDLRVASRTSSFAFKGKVQDVLEIADQLRVDTVVEGSVRKVQNRVRVTAQLIDADDGYHLWSETYDRDLEDIFKVQDEIARSIVDALKLELVGEEANRLVSPETEDLEAYTLYLKGRFFFNRFQEADLRRSLDLYRQALEHDPGYGRAWAGMADTWMQLADDWVAPETAYPEAKAAAERALELDESLAEAHTARGKVLGWFDWDFDGAELALRRAVAANPRYADAHWGLASILPANGQMEEAIDEARTTLALDPLSGIFSYWLARYLYFARRPGEAHEAATHAAEVDPTSFRPLLILGLSHLMEGRGEEALRSFERALEVSGVASVHAFIARALAAVGREDDARELLVRIESGDEYVRHEFMAPAWAALGELDRALEALETAYQERSAGLIYLHVDPSYDLLRGDRRYLDLVRRIGLKSG